jgi:hypothetical protein
MTEEHNELRRVNWTEAAPFTRIFQSFRMAACQPTKIGLALGAILVLFIAGWLMGVIWSWTGTTAYPYEIYDYASMSPRDFEARREAWEDGRLEAAANWLAETRGQHQSLDELRGLLGDATRSGYYMQGFREATKERKQPDYDGDELNAVKVAEKAREDETSVSELVSKAMEIREAMADEIEEVLDDAHEQAENLLSNAENISDEARQRQEDLLEDDLERAYRAVTVARVNWARQEAALAGRQIFTSFLDYEIGCIKNALSSVWHGRIFSGLSQYRAIAQRKRAGQMPVTADFDPLPEDQRAPDIPLRQANADQIPNVNLTDDNSLGFVAWIVMALYGFCWMVSEHWLFAILFLPLLLAIAACFGGAISRISALDFARGERISIGQSLRFSAGKFLSFFLSPVLVLVLVLLGGAMLALGGLIGSIPIVGEIFMALLFFLALIMGMVLAFFLIGFVAGGPLMYPTIAVEGSDSFDGISRSIMYVYSKPWHALFYGVVTVVYGALTYLFVRFFVYLALLATHTFVSWGVIGGGSSLGPATDKLDVLWAMPSFDVLFAGIQWEAMSGWMAVWAFILNCWVFLIAALPIAYLISFFFTSSTVVYFLLRRKIDATELDDVYVEELEEQEWIEPEPEQTEQPAEGEATEAQAQGEEPGQEPEAPQESEESTEEPSSDQESKPEGEEGGDQENRQE